MSERVGFVLVVKPDRIDEYVEAHREVWPEMLDALKGAGIRNYTIFRAGTHVFGYFETDDREATERFLAEQPVCARWQDRMAEYLVARVDDAGPTPLEEIFRLD
jgi:L-rhamnose mutarotase